MSVILMTTLFKKGIFIKLYYKEKFDADHLRA